VNTLTGAIDREQTVTHPGGGDCGLDSPPCEQDVALCVKAIK